MQYINVISVMDYDTVTNRRFKNVQILAKELEAITESGAKIITVTECADNYVVVYEK